jgi:hypothetical protein
MSVDVTKTGPDTAKRISFLVNDDVRDDESFGGLVPPFVVVFVVLVVVAKKSIRIDHNAGAHGDSDFVVNNSMIPGLDDDGCVDDVDDRDGDGDDGDVIDNPCTPTTIIVVVELAINIHNDVIIIIVIINNNMSGGPLLVFLEVVAGDLIIIIVVCHGRCCCLPIFAIGG